MTFLPDIFRMISLWGDEESACAVPTPDAAHLSASATWLDSTEQGRFLLVPV